MKATGDAALLRVTVPADAEIYVNGKQTLAEGSQRQYRSEGLVAGKQYAYEVEARVEREGKQQVEKKVVSLSAGTESHLIFTFPDSPHSDDEADASATDEETGVEAADADAGTQTSNATRTPTLLTLRVPAQAKVSLEGADTGLTGTQRVFRSMGLAEGQVWRGYRVRVVMEREGREIVQEKSLDLRGGDSHDLRFDFDANRLATR